MNKPKSLAQDTVGADIPSQGAQVVPGQQPPPPNPLAVKPVGKLAPKKKKITSIDQLKAVAAKMKAKKPVGY